MVSSGVWEKIEISVAFISSIRFFFFCDYFCRYEPSGLFLIGFGKNKTGGVPEYVKEFRFTLIIICTDEAN